MADENPTYRMVPMKPLDELQDADVLEINDNAASQWTSGEYRRLNADDIRRFLAAEEATKKAERASVAVDKTEEIGEDSPDNMELSQYIETMSCSCKSKATT